mgnify:CR=1 FL=1
MRLLAFICGHKALIIQSANNAKNANVFYNITTGLQEPDQQINLIRLHKNNKIMFDLRSFAFISGHKLLYSLRSALFIYGILAASGCATLDGPPNPDDPLESYNRAMFSFN